MAGKGALMRTIIPDWPTVLTVDPGVNGHGYALFLNTGVLHSCGYATGHLPHASRTMRSLTAARDLNERVAYGYRPNIHSLIAEIPVVRDVTKQKGDQADIVALSVSLGMVVQVFNSATPFLLEPENWKKQMPKEVVHRRMMARMTASEKVILGRARVDVGDTLWHNVLDAVALGYVGGHLKLGWQKPEGLV